jgi:rRNA maturation RNase YbeY
VPRAEGRRLEPVPRGKGASGLARARDPAERASLSLVGDAEIRELNRVHRGKDRPTDVLAFPLHEPPIPPAAASLGDVVISIDTATLAAAERRRPLAACLDELLIHGILHLLGYDHEASPTEERRMARKARAVRVAIGALAPPARAGAGVKRVRRTTGKRTARGCA